MTLPDRLTLVLVREGDQMVALCLEYYIVAQGDDVPSALRSWADVFAAQIEIDLREGREPLAGIQPAPEKDYHDIVASMVEEAPRRFRGKAIIAALVKAGLLPRRLA
jgi:hypothetical protein